MQAEDREFVERVLAGETELFERLVRKYHRFGCAIAFGVLGDFQLAEDVVQDAFLKAYRALSTLQSPGRFQVWFAGIVKKRAIDVLRQTRTIARRAVSLDRRSSGSGAENTRRREIPADGHDPVVERFERQEQRERILAEISELPEADRTVIVLKHMDGLSYREIATLTGTTVGAVESRLFRARSQLRARLEPLLRTDSCE